MLHLVHLRFLVATERQQFLMLLGLSLGVIALTVMAYFSDPRIFQKFLGRINPLLAGPLIVLLGAALLTMLMARGWFAVYRPDQPGRYLVLAALAAVLGAIIIVIDFQIVFPEDLNVLFPQSLLYYPATGYAVEVLFHLLPLTLSLLLVMSLTKNVGFEAIIWPCIFVVATLEPIFQTAPMVGKYPAWAVGYVALHIFAINLIQLVYFRQYDFVSMYAFRLMYYLLWHVVWGHVRIRLLF